MNRDPEKRFVTVTEAAKVIGCETETLWSVIFLHDVRSDASLISFADGVRFPAWPSDSERLIKLSRLQELKTLVELDKANSHG
jgi:hypothetical protein